VAPDWLSYVAVDDADATTPLTITQKLRLIPDQEMIEYFCTDNEKDRLHYVTTK
jgi:hypothetical protein